MSLFGSCFQLTGVPPHGPSPPPRWTFAQSHVEQYSFLRAQLPSLTVDDIRQETLFSYRSSYPLPPKQVRRCVPFFLPLPRRRSFNIFSRPSYPNGDLARTSAIQLTAPPRPPCILFPVLLFIPPPSFERQVPTPFFVAQNFIHLQISPHFRPDHSLIQYVWRLAPLRTFSSSSIGRFQSHKDSQSFPLCPIVCTFTRHP